MTSVLFASLLLAAAGRADVVKLPIMLEKNLPLALVKIGGHELTFIIDSAAAGCVIDPARARAIGLKVAGEGYSTGSGGMQAVQFVHNVKLEIGGIAIDIPRVHTFDMAALKFKGAIDGILGSPLFERYVVEIDYPRLVMRIMRPGAYKPAAGSTVLPMRMTTGPTVQGTIRLRGRKPITAPMQLDTGSAHVLTLCTEFVDRLKLLDSADELEPGHTLGLGGGSPDMVGRIEEFRVGNAVLEKPLVRFGRQSVGSLASERHFAANIGGDFLKRYRVAFDFPGSRFVIMTPPPTAAPAK